MDLRGGQVTRDVFAAAQTEAKFWQTQPFSVCTEETSSADTEKYFSWLMH